MSPWGGDSKFWGWGGDNLLLCFSKNNIECKNYQDLSPDTTTTISSGSLVFNNRKRKRLSTFLESIFPFLGGLGNALNFATTGSW